MSRKPSFANLGARLAPKAAEAPATRVETEERGPDEAPAGGRTRAARQPDGRKGILVRARPEAWKALKMIALKMIALKMIVLKMVRIKETKGTAVMRTKLTTTARLHGAQYGLGRRGKAT